MQKSIFQKLSVNNKKTNTIFLPKILNRSCTEKNEKPPEKIGNWFLIKINIQKALNNKLCLADSGEYIFFVQ